MALVNLDNPEEVKKYEEFITNTPYAVTTQAMAWAKVKDNWNSFYISTLTNNHIFILLLFYCSILFYFKLYSVMILLSNHLIVFKWFE